MPNYTVGHSLCYLLLCEIWDWVGLACEEFVTCIGNEGERGDCQHDGKWKHECGSILYHAVGHHSH